MSQLKTNSIKHIGNTGDPNIELSSDGNIEVNGSADLDGPVSPGDADSGIAIKTVTGETGGCLLSTNKTDITTSRTANIGADAQRWNNGYFAGSVSAPNVATAFVNFAGTAAVGSQNIRSSYNVSGVNKTGTGRYTITFSTAMDNSNFALMVSSNDISAVIDSISTTSFEMSVFNSSGSRTDATVICAVVYGGK